MRNHQFEVLHLKFAVALVMAVRPGNSVDRTQENITVTDLPPDYVIQESLHLRSEKTSSIPSPRTAVKNAEEINRLRAEVQSLTQRLHRVAVHDAVDEGRRAHRASFSSESDTSSPPRRPPKASRHAHQSGPGKLSPVGEHEDEYRAHAPHRPRLLQSPDTNAKRPVPGSRGGSSVLSEQPSARSGPSVRGSIPTSPEADSNAIARVWARGALSAAGALHAGAGDPGGASRRAVLDGLRGDALHGSADGARPRRQRHPSVASNASSGWSLWAPGQVAGAGAGAAGAELGEPSRSPSLGENQGRGLGLGLGAGTGAAVGLLSRQAGLARPATAEVSKLTSQEMLVRQVAANMMTLVAGRKPVVLVATGSYNPVHLYHLRMFYLARNVSRAMCAALHCTAAQYLA